MAAADADPVLFLNALTHIGYNAPTRTHFANCIAATANDLAVSGVQRLRKVLDGFNQKPPPTTGGRGAQALAKNFSMAKNDKLLGFKLWIDYRKAQGQIPDPDLYDLALRCSKNS